MFLRAREKVKQRKKVGGSTRENKGGVGVSQTLKQASALLFYFKLFISLLYDNLALTMSTAECSQCDDSHISGLKLPTIHFNRILGLTF